jgi:hypothetical protein
VALPRLKCTGQIVLTLFRATGAGKNLQTCNVNDLKEKNRTKINAFHAYY